MGAKTPRRISTAEESSVPAEAVQDGKGSLSVCCCGWLCCVCPCPGSQVCVSSGPLQPPACAVTCLHDLPPAENFSSPRMEAPRTYSDAGEAVWRLLCVILMTFGVEFLIVWASWQLCFYSLPPLALGRMSPVRWAIDTLELQVSKNATESRPVICNSYSHMLNKNPSQPTK